MMIRNEKRETGWNLDTSFARLPASLFAYARPQHAPAPDLVLLNVPLAKSLGLAVGFLESEDGLEVLAGNEIPEGATPIAQAYAGHQFGNFTMLGDGRAVLIGEQMTPAGKRVDIQLKGAGRTKYSRGGDGRAGLGPMLREYLISEAMHGLGIPTTRSLAVVATGEPVYRETELNGAVLTRIASSHIRVGTFQYAVNFGTVEDLQELADYTIQRHFPEVETANNKYVALLQEVIIRQAKLIAKWQLIGFIHGVMNTDNMTISGETIDYGPCAFMDTYHSKTVFSSIDQQGRYAYRNQPPIALWNLVRFAETLIPLIDEEQEKAVEIAQKTLDTFAPLFHEHYIGGMRNKLGLFNEEDEDDVLIENVLEMMEKYEADYTNTFRALTLDEVEKTILFGTTEFTAWYEKWRARLTRQEQSAEESVTLMKAHNPSIIPRNHRVEAALESAVSQGDYTVLKQLLEVLKNPYAYTSDQEEYAKMPDKPDQTYQTFCGT